MDNISEPYKSPIRLIRYVGESIDTYSQRSVSMAKKLLLAELSLQGTELTIDDVHYSKNDINALLNDLNETNWRFHCMIFLNDAMLNFLEKQQFSTEGFMSVEHLVKYEGFVPFVSPYFAWSFNEVSGKLVRVYETNALPDLVAQQKYILVEHAELAYRKLRVYFADLIYNIKFLTWETFSKDESVLYFLFTASWIKAVSELPAMFDETRDELVEEVLALVHGFQNHATSEYLYEVCTKLYSIPCSIELKEHIEQYLTVLRKRKTQQNKAVAAETESGGTNPLRWIFGIIWVIFALVRLSSGGGCNSSRYNNVDYSSFTTSLRDMQNTAMNQKSSAQNYLSFLDAINELSRHNNQGTAVKIKTGSAPFTKISSEPLLAGDVQLTVENKSGKDAVLLYRSLNYNILSPADKIMAAYIKNGESYVMDFNTSGQLNFAFGKNWIRKNKLASFDLTQISFRTDAAGLDTSLIEKLFVNEFFRQPMFNQLYLEKNITFSQSFYNQQQEGTTVLYSPRQISDEKIGEIASEVKLVLKPSNGSVAIGAEGDYYILLEKRSD